MSVEHCDSLRPSLKAKLQDAGLLSIDDVVSTWSSSSNTNSHNSDSTTSASGVSSALLQKRCPQLTDAEASEVFDCVGSRVIFPELRTLQDLHDLLSSAPRVTTFCRGLDVLLGGGVPVGGVSEVCGPPGAGKTQLLMQLAVSCALPRALGGLHGGCLFVDTEGSFVAERFREIAAAAVAQVQRIIAQEEAVGIFAGGGGGVVAAAAAAAGVREGVDERASAHGNYSAHTSGNINGNTSGNINGNTSGNINGSTSGNINGSTSGNINGSTSGNINGSTSGNINGSTSGNINGSTGRGRKRGREGTPMPSSVAAAAGHFTVEYVMQQTQYVRVLDAASLMALLYTLPDLLAERPELRMIVIDSVAFPFRVFGHLSGDAEAEDEDDTTNTNGSGTRERLWQRSRLLFSCGQLLQEIAREHQLCIVVSNHMTGRLTNGPGGDAVRVLVPALGDAWAYGIATRLLITHQHFAGERREECHENIVFISEPVVEGWSTANAVQHRVARLVKSPTQPCGQCCLSVSQKGIRDVFRPPTAGA